MQPSCGRLAFTWIINRHNRLMVGVSQQSACVYSIMCRPEFKSIWYPTQWPPPEMSPIPIHPLSRIPLLGWLFQYFRWLRYSARYRREILEPIDEEIFTQLKVRPTDGPWPVHSEQKALAAIVSDAVALEKGLAHSPALHPDDPFPLLFWGPYDDITRANVCLESRQQMSLEIPQDVLMKAWNERWTIRRFVEQCTILAKTRTTKLANTSGLETREAEF